MTVGMSAANLVTPWLNLLRPGGTFTAVATPYAQLHTADPGAVGTTAVSALATTPVRQALTFNASAAGSALALTSPPSAWTAAAGTGETISHISVWGAASAGTFYYSVALTTPQPWVVSNTFTLSTLTFALSPIAA